MFHYSPRRRKNAKTEKHSPPGVESLPAGQAGGQGVRLTLILIAAFLLAFFISQRIFQSFPSPAGWKTIITSDGRGYYAYLPAIFLYGDLTFRQTTVSEKRLYGLRDYNPAYLVKYGNQQVNKYFAGEALLLLPFFLLAVLLTWITGLPMDGYSFFFQVSVGIGALFYLFTGLVFLRKILNKLSPDSKIIILVLSGILFATNLFYYAMWQPSMSHAYSFFAINGFLWLMVRVRERSRVIDFILAGVFLGYTVLLRPVNGLIIMLAPFLCISREELNNLFRNLFSARILFFVLAASLIILIQPLIWYFETGRLFLWPYREEGFNFLKPEFYNVLFSYRKGLFIYTPFLLLAIPGIFVFFRKPWFRPVSLLLFLGCMTWVTASWWNWYYGDSFGMRPFIDFYGVFAIPVAALIQKFRSRIVFIVFASVTCLLIFLNLFQTWQYNNRVIHPFNMNGEKYRYVFMRADSSVINCFGGSDELPFRGAGLQQPVSVLQNGFEKELPGWNNDKRISLPGLAFNGKYTGVLDSLDLFSPGLEIRTGSLGDLPARFYCRVSVVIRDSLPGASNNAYFVASIDSFDYRHHFWYGFKLNDIPHREKNVWRKEKYGFNLPEVTNPEARIKMYVWNPQRKTFYIDDLQIEFYGGTGSKKRSVAE